MHGELGYKKLSTYVSKPHKEIPRKILNYKQSASFPYTNFLQTSSLLHTIVYCIWVSSTP